VKNPIKNQASSIKHQASSIKNPIQTSHLASPNFYQPFEQVLRCALKLKWFDRTHHAID
jgi:hypothetical protein